jgi:hypothetical protein
MRYLIDNQVIWLFRLQNVYSQIKEVRLNPLSKPISQPPSPYPVSYQPPDVTVEYLFFLYVSSSSKTPLSSQVDNLVKTPLSSQVDNLVLIDIFNVVSRVLSIVFFLRTSSCFPPDCKTDSLYPDSRSRATMELSPHPKDISVRLRTWFTHSLICVSSRKLSSGWGPLSPSR